MVYPGRPQLKGTASPRGQAAEQRARLLEFVPAGYRDG